MLLHNLFENKHVSESDTASVNWHTDSEQRSMDATRSARLNREREPAGSEAIDARLRAQNDQLAQYAQSGQFWLKQKDTQQHISDAFTGKAAANAAALALLKQQPELKGNLVITAYGPGETQGVTEGTDPNTQSHADAFKSETDTMKPGTNKYVGRKGGKEVTAKKDGQGNVKFYHRDGIKGPLKRVTEGTTTTWEVSYDYGPHMSKTVKVKAGSEQEARAKVEKAAEKKGLDIMINSVEQGVSEGSEYKSRHAHKQEQDKAYADYRTKHATSSMALMTRAEFAKDQRERAAKKKQGVAEAPGAETLGHNQSTVSSNLSSLDLDEAHYDQGDYHNARRGSEYGRDMSNLGNGGSRFPGAGREDDLKGQSKHLPADPFGRTSGAVPRSNPGQVHHIALPGEVDEGEKVGNMDADAFDAAMSRLKKLAGAGPMKTVYDPNKRVYRNVPTAQQPPQQPRK